MFHWKENIFFGRKADGDVRVIAFKSPPPFPPDPHTDYPSMLTRIDLTIDAGSWASIVSSVSAQGENNMRFYDALRFHNDQLSMPRPVMVERSDVFTRTDCIFNYCPHPNECRQACQNKRGG